MAKLTLKEIFIECQRPVQTHGKLVKELIKLYKAVSGFTLCLSHSLEVDSSQARELDL